ncbi:MAG: ATP-binding protein [Rhodospirillaceae bacterium]|nr:ATP-binding protein [Rhodospirillaceae bacterium]
MSSLLDRIWRLRDDGPFRWLPTIAVLLCAILFATASIWERRQILAAGERDSQAITRWFAVIVEEADDTLEDVLETVRARSDLTVPISAAELRSHAADILRLSRDQQTGTRLMFINADGQIAASSDDLVPRDSDLSARDDFIRIKAQPRPGLHLWRADVDPSNSARADQTFAISKAAIDDDGDFIGLVIAEIEIDDFQDNVDALDLGAHGSVGGIASDGTLLFRFPHDAPIVGADFSKSRLFLEFLPRSLSGAFRDIAPDKIARIVTYKSILDGAIIVYSGIGVDDILAPWRTRNAGGFAILVVLSVITVVVQFRGLAVRRKAFIEVESFGVQLSTLTLASTKIASLETVEAIANYAVELARELVPCHQALLRVNHTSPHRSVRAFSLSDKYSPLRELHETSADEWITHVALQEGTSLRLTRSEMLAHPDWKDFCAAADRQPPLHGLLALPLLKRDGTVLGTLLLSDRLHGEFTPDDEVLLTQLARIASISIEGVWLLQSARSAARAADQATKEAREARDRMTAVLSSISDAFCSFDNDWRFTFINDRAAKLFQTTGPLIGKFLWEALPWMEGTGFISRLKEIKATGEADRFEHHGEKFDRWYDVRVYPFADGVSVYLHDETVEHRALGALQQAQKMEAVGQLTGGIAHDFNNLLTVINGNAENLIDDAPPGSPQKEALGLILAAGRRGAELTQRMLAFARRQPLEPQIIQVNELVAEMAQLLQRTLSEAINLAFVLPENLWLARVDAAQLESALVNIAINSRDAMPTGGKLTIETSNAVIDEGFDAEFKGVAKGEYVRISVSDTGCGMPPEILTRVFEPFFTTKEVGKGTGLGLPMVYGFVRQSGGYVKIYSEPGLGTTVNIYLPRASGQVEPLARTADDGAELGHGELVLLVEDNEMVRSYVVATTESLGYRVVQASDGHEARALIANGVRPDLLLTDIVLPGGLNGRALADGLVAEGKVKRVLFMSGYAENAVAHHGRVVPGMILISKPFTKSDFAAKLRLALVSPYPSPVADA